MSNDPTQPAQEQAIELLPCEQCGHLPRIAQCGCVYCPHEECANWGRHITIADWTTHRRVTPTHVPSEGQTPSADAAYAAHPVLDTQTHRDAILLTEARKIEQELRSTITALEAQLAAMREALQKVANLSDGKNRLYEGGCQGIAILALASTSGQALLDRLDEAEKDKALLDWLEKTPAGIGVPFMGEPNFHIFSDKGDGEGPTLREAIDSAMRKDGHES